MFHIPQETIVKGHPNYEYRQKGKQATLSCGYGGGVGALKAMGAKMPEEEEEEIPEAKRKLRTRQFNRRYHIEPTLTYNSPPLSIIH